MFFLKVIFSIIFLILLLNIFAQVSDRYSCNVYIASHEQLRYINNSGQGLKQQNECNLPVKETFFFKLRFHDYNDNYKGWVHPLIGDPADGPLFTYKRESLFNKQNLNLKLTRRKYFEVPILFRDERHAQLILSKKDYKLINQRFNECSTLKFIKNTEIETPIRVDRYIEKEFLTDEWNEIFSPCRGIRSCTLWHRNFI